MRTANQRSSFLLLLLVLLPTELLSELGRMTRSFSTAGGLRHITQYSFSIARSALRRQKKGQPEARRDSKEEKS